MDGVRRLWDQDLPDEEWVVGFLKAVGSDPDPFPPEFLAAALPLVPVFRRGRPIWYPDLPLDELADAPFPTLIVSGGHSPGFEAICDDLAARIGASRRVVEGAGHEIQFTGQPINEVLLALWRTPLEPALDTGVAVEAAAAPRSGAVQPPVLTPHRARRALQ